MSLRNRVTAIVVGLVIVALVVTDIVTYTALHGYLSQRLDQQLASIVSPVTQALQFPNDPRNLSLAPPPGTYGELYSVSGHSLAILHTTDDPHAGVPSIPTSLVRQAARSAGAGRQLLTVLPGSKGTQFRAVAEVVVGSGPFDAGSEVVVVAIPYSDLNATLNHLLLLELVVSGAIGLALAAGAWLVVRLGLRPLERMAETADEIAQGDLTQRVDDTDTRTEVGRLGDALNVMLSRIETAFKEREESEQRLRRFVADASHELRTPLTSIRGYAELFDHGLAERPADLRRAMRRIESESMRMGVLVEDLLLLARLDQGRPLELDAVDLSAIAADAVSDARVVDPGRTITLATGYSVVVQGDDLRLRQVVANLVSNALSHTPGGTPVEISVEADSATAYLSVVDHGPGVPGEMAGQVFERFWRSDPSRVRAGGGSGLGLSIVAAIASAHGGEVHLLQTEGGGATFRLDLPRTAPSSEHAGPGSEVSGPSFEQTRPPVSEPPAGEREPHTATFAE